ncbi:MAG TPA: helix-turn-helix domain-containing protein [Candidatus Baltobacteraceae bacterium]|nr:helix-turn-helix domain-containing protein [Candidatus Baltobacteraceae bacterium]
MQHANLSAQIPCPIARSLEIVGEWWTLLIVRDALLGARRFDEFKATGIADNILAARLKKLVAEGVLKKRAYQQHPVRYDYALTMKGRALAPVVIALRTWGKRFTKGPDSSGVTHSACGHELTAALYCAECSRVALGDDVRAVPARSERAS